MRKLRLLAIVLAIVLLSSICLSACKKNGNDEYVITLDTTKSFTLRVGDEVDFTQYFIVKDADGNPVTVTKDMLDLSNVDLTKPGMFSVTLTIGKSTKSAPFNVIEKGKDDIKPSEPEYTVTINLNKSTVLEVGEVVDYTQYFIVKNRDGLQIMVTNDMLDLSKVDVSKPGTFTVTLKIGDVTKQLEFRVIEKQTSDDTPTMPAELAAVLAKYEDDSKWNFSDAVTVSYDGDTATESYDYMGYNIRYTYSYNGELYVEYLGFDEESYTYYYFYDNGDGTYGALDQESDYFWIYVAYMNFIDLTALADYSYTADGNNKYVATNPDAAGNGVIYDYEDSIWTTFAVYTANGEISKIVAATDDGYSQEHVFTKHGQINFTLPEISDPSVQPEEPTMPDALAAIINQYADDSTWNFAVNLTVSSDGQTFNDYYEYLGYNIKNRYIYEGFYYTDYVGYDEGDNTFYFYYDNGDDTYEKFDWDTDEFWECYNNMYLVDMVRLANYSFTFDGTKYVATYPNAAGCGVLYESSWTSFEVYVANGEITKIVAAIGDVYTEEYVFSKHGQIDFALPGESAGGNDTPSTPTGVMDKQTYDPETFDKDNLQDRLLGFEEVIGLPSTGTYDALVVPVQFSGDSITERQLADLNKAFNGTAADTGWESVNSYYYKSSYGKLNISFDIATVYSAQYAASYYENYKVWDNEYQQYFYVGEEIILTEVLAYLESRMDLTKYDTNGDGCIDAVYLIYSAPVDYAQADFFWAFTTWYTGENKYDELDVYYYFFAGFDFMYEATAQDNFSGADYYYDGLIINAMTYIHETGHLLGLDDYYDYEERKGSDEGLGGADMMDYNVGDHGVYSKMMLGWLTPTIVTETTTLTISSSQAKGDAILIPLNFNNSYFCEYLLVDLYSAQGLNALEAATEGSYLYDGAEYGVRIYHVSAWAKNPFENEYGSYTDYNNSDTSIPLIKLVEADGDRKFSSSNGWAADTDLWQAGQKLSTVFPTYTRNDNKLLNFDIEIISVSATEAKITITFAE